MKISITNQNCRVFRVCGEEDDYEPDGDHTVIKVASSEKLEEEIKWYKDQADKSGAGTDRYYRQIARGLAEYRGCF